MPDVLALQRTAGNAAVSRLLAVQRLPIQVGDNQTVEAELIGGRYYRLDPKVAREAYIVEDSVDAGSGAITDPVLRLQVLKYLRGGVPLFRGVTRWHSTWDSIQTKGIINPLGGGDIPDFDTSRTKYFPFTADLTVAGSARRQLTGMGEGDVLQFVHGYDPGKPFDVGCVVSVVANKETAVGFYNATEVQFKGPVKVQVLERFTTSTPLGTPLQDIGITGGGKLGDILPAAPSEAEKKKYRETHGGLRHEPLSARLGSLFSGMWSK